MQIQKIQINLSPEVVANLSVKSKAMGLSVTKFVRFLLLKEAYDISESIPQYAMSDKLEKETLKAVEEHKQGKSTELKKIDDLDNL